MTEPVDRRRFLAASAAAAAGTLLRAARIEAATENVPESPSPFTVEELPSALVLRNGAESVRITVCAPDVVHIVAAAQGMPGGASPVTPWILTPYSPQKLEVTRTEGRVAVRTPKMSIEVDLKVGLLRFLDPSGKPVLEESPRVPRRYVPQSVNGEMVYRVEQRFYPDALEGIYGLGQHQGGAFDQRGLSLGQARPELTQLPGHEAARPARPRNRYL